MKQSVELTLPLAAVERLTPFQQMRVWHDFLFMVDAHPEHWHLASTSHPLVYDAKQNRYIEQKAIVKYLFEKENGATD